MLGTPSAYLLENTEGIRKAHLLPPGQTIQLLRQQVLRHLLCARSLMAKYKQSSIFLLNSVFPQARS